MAEEQKKINVEIVIPSVSEVESDAALFALFDFLLTEKTRAIPKEKVEIKKIIKPLP
ncbi:MAG: hypothetical protein WC348_01820 [Patescibacteria group bacterium]|jgi:hypothetical protein